MSNETASPLIQMMSERLAHIVAIATIEVETEIAAFALLFYTFLLHLDDEIQYIWKPKFTFTTFLYLFSKYLTFLNPIFRAVGGFVLSIRLCNALAFLGNSTMVLSLVGIQGLISVRTYAICQGYRPITIALSAFFFVTLALHIYSATIPNCSPPPAYVSTLVLISNIAIVLLDILAFLAVICWVWGLWKEQRSLGLQTKENLATVLLQQGILRFCFLLFFTITGSVAQYIPLIIGTDVQAFQNVLSAILICEFTLALRQRNSRKPFPNQSALQLPTLSFQENPVQSIQSLLEHLHESIIVDMGERDAPVDVDTQGQEEQDEAS